MAGAAVAVLVALALLGVGHSSRIARPALARVDQGLWDRLLRRYVDDDGLVAYRALNTQGRAQLDRYLAELARANPAGMSRNEQLAFWINAYNAGVVAAVLRGYSPETTLSRAQLFRWYAFPVAGRSRTPDEIENDVLRQQFHDPRIHFAIVCGATSCPKLRREAYRGDRLDEQLNDQARRFIEDPSRNDLDPTVGRIELSSIFDWFRPDFIAVAGSLPDFAARYVATPQQAEALHRYGDQIGFLEYNWALNAQPGQRIS